MPISTKEIDARLKKAVKIEDRERKIAYVLSLAQWLMSDLQMEQAEKGLVLPEQLPPSKT